MNFKEIWNKEVKRLADAFWERKRSENDAKRNAKTEEERLSIRSKNIIKAQLELHAEAAIITHEREEHERKLKIEQEWDDIEIWTRAVLASEGTPLAHEKELLLQHQARVYKITGQLGRLYDHDAMCQAAYFAENGRLWHLDV